MDDISATLPRSRRRALWQFSLRELLLLTLVAALALTIWRMAPRRLEPTPFLSACNVYDLVRKIRTTANPALAHKTRMRNAESGWLGGVESGNVGVKNTYHFRLDDVSTSPAAILVALRPAMRSLLLAKDCEVLDEGKSPSPELPGFHFRYRHGDTEGVVNVDGVADDDELWVFVLIHEFRGR